MKRLIKLGISLGVYAWDRCRNAFVRVMGRQPTGTCVVLYYHGIKPDQRALFARQMDEVLRLAKPAPADWREALPAGQHHCVITFDDGFVSVIENALPELESRKIPSTIFVPTGSLGGRPAWIKNPSHAAYHETVMTFDQVAALKNAKLVTIGSHSISHANFLALDEAQTREEFAESKARLEAALGQKVGLFSFPHGECNARLIEEAKSVGYDRVFTVEPEFALKRPEEFITGRVPVEPDNWALEFRLKVLGAYRWAARSRA